jgi:hypothetical protein
MPTTAEETAAGKEALRGGIESEFNGLRDEIERTFSTAKYNLEQQYFEDIKANRLAKENAMAAAGLNRDGSSNYDRPSDA